MLYANVRILNAPYNIDKSYCYHVPLQLEKSIRPGSIAVVPFGGGNSTKNAVVESLSETSAFDKTKPILGIPGKYMSIKPELLELCHFMSDRLFCSVGDAIKCVLPSGLGVKRTVFYMPAETPPSEETLDKVNASAQTMLDYIARTGRVSITELRKQFGSAAAAGAKVLCELGFCSTEDGYECTVNTKNEKYAELAENADADYMEKLSASRALTPKQKAVCETLLVSESAVPASELAATAGCGMSVLNELAKKGVIRLFDVDLDRSEDILHSFDPKEYGDFTLSDEQNEALRALSELYESEEPQAALLWGVTGSGKTNVILKLIDRVLADGKTVLVLVPEIALTSQTVGRFAARYRKEGIALIHSALSAGERMDAWKKIHDGEARIIIGTRSAVFAPVENLGLIVMDEEHEGSFKSDKSPKYHAREIAKFRCVYHKALLVMASATPCIESFYKAKTGKYKLVTLPSRYGGNSLPDVTFYDMKSEPYYELPQDAFRSSDAFDPFLPAEGADARPAPFSDTASPEESGIPLVLGSLLKEELAACLDRGEQAILFVNRRGYRAFALCRGCGHVFTCPNCSVSLTHHKNKRTGTGRMICHYCGYTEPIPNVCPACKKEHISFVGSGTQLVEETLATHFPQARVLRMDADTTGGKFGHERILSDFRAGKADILVGTQMVAKGHDFPRVSLVGVVMADTSLFVNDFRAGEKTFCLLTQVLGRAGRSDKVKGRAVVQTYVPDNEILRYAADQNYEKYYNAEIGFRKASVFPPFCDLITVNFSSPVEMNVVNAVKIFGAELDNLAKIEYADVKFILFGPFKHEIYRLAGKYRMRFLIKCRASARMRSMLSVLLKKYIPALKDVSVSADINPTNL